MDQLTNENYLLSFRLRILTDRMGTSFGNHSAPNGAGDEELATCVLQLHKEGTQNQETYVQHNTNLLHLEALH